jgi:hypothetical protein
MTDQRSQAQRAHLPRRTVLTGLGATAAVTTLGGCMTSLKTQNFRITVEDENGRVFGSGVYQWAEKVPAVQFRIYGGADGEAFQIQHPTHGMMYVCIRRLSGLSILKAYQAAGLVPKLERDGTRDGIGTEGFRLLQRIKAKVALHADATPVVIKFLDDADPASWRVLASSRDPNELGLRFFAQTTTDGMTNSILQKLPWLKDLGFSEHLPLAGSRSPPGEHPTRLSFLSIAQIDWLTAQKSKK